MDLLKKHYEKVLLSFVLLILAGTAIGLFIEIAKKRDEVQVSIPPLEKGPKVKPLELAAYEKAAERLNNPPTLDFSVPHHLFNAVVWKQRPDGTLFKIVTQDVPKLLKTTPLYLIISFEKATGTGFQFGITREAALSPQLRKKVQRYLTEGGKSDMFALKKVEGTMEQPTAFRLELNENKQEIVVTPDQPFKRVDGYSADMNYAVDNKSFNDTRVGSTISFGGEQYKVVAISENEVTVRALSNDKQTTIKKAGQ